MCFQTPLWWLLGVKGRELQQSSRILTPGAVTVALKKVVWSEGKEYWIGGGGGVDMKAADQ